MTITFLFFIGLCLGSFVNALVWRLRMQETAKTDKQKSKFSISKGRSMCVYCRHILSPMDLVPVLSWVLLRGKCRYCHKLIDWQYPIVEFVTALAFTASYVFWPLNVGIDYNIVGFITWLVVLVGLAALFIYDLKYFILPNKIILPLTLFTIFSVIIQTILGHKLLIAGNAFGAALVGGGIFYMLFQVSDGRWIGGGDVKLGFLLGMLVGDPLLALFFLFISSLLGSLVSIPALIAKKASPMTKIPFGPFLIAGAFITMLFGPYLLDWYGGLLFSS